MKPNVAPTLVWLLEITCEHKLKSDVVECLKKLESLSPEKKAEALMKKIKEAIVQMEKNSTQPKEMSTCINLLNLLIRRMCKDVVMAESQEDFLNNPYILEISRILEENLFAYDFRQSALKSTTQTAKTAKKEFA